MQFPSKDTFLSIGSGLAVVGIVLLLLTVLTRAVDSTIVGKTGSQHAVLVECAGVGQPSIQIQATRNQVQLTDTGFVLWQDGGQLRYYAAPGSFCAVSPPLEELE